MRNWKKLQLVSSFFNEDINATQKLKAYTAPPIKALSNHIQFFLSSNFFYKLFIFFLRETINTSDCNIWDLILISAITIIIIIIIIIITIVIIMLIKITVTVILEKSSGGGSKQGIEAAWSTPIHDVKWWISHFRGMHMPHRNLTASEEELF